MPLIYWVSLLILPGLPGWAVVAMGGATPETGLARALLCLSALWATVVGMAWLLNEPASTWVRVPAGLLLGTYVFVGLPQSLTWVGQRARYIAVAPAIAPPAPPVPQLAMTRPPTFRELFAHDFADLPSLARKVGLQSARTGERSSVPVRMIIEPDRHEKFLAVFIERNTSSFNTCVFFLYNLDLVFQELNLEPIETRGSMVAQPVHGKDFGFDHNIYFYMAEDMSQDAQVYLEKAFREQGVYAHFRGAGYYAMRWHDLELQQSVMQREAEK
jgi:hypothetical protein